MTHTITSLPYSPTMFVGRKDDTKKIMDIMDDIISDKEPDIRIITFSGQRGIGKSWLLKQIAHLLTERYPNKVKVFVDDLKDYDQQNPATSIVSILQKFQQTILQERISKTTPAEMSRKIIQALQTTQFRDNIPLVVLLDTVHEADWQLLDAIEEYLLGPLALEKQVLIVMTGRGRPYRWKSWPLRFNVEQHDLPPFNRHDTKEQLRRLDETLVEQSDYIYTRSQGAPLVTYALSQDDDVAKAINMMLEVITDSTERQRFQQYFEALCVLRSFDEERIEGMLSIYDKESEGWSFPKARDVRKKIVALAFASWDNDEQAYVLDPLIKKLIEQYLKETQPSKWAYLQRAAISLYQEWLDKFPGAAKQWQAETKYHQELLVN
ncbi:AAA family ATPase [Anaerolineales bacterium HSG6]|nr:AAA family ATPase [Anaerolineales bacterium HSG6]